MREATQGGTLKKNTCMYVCMYHTYVCIEHTHTHTHTHVYTCTHTHTHTPLLTPDERGGSGLAPRSSHRAALFCEIMQ